MLDKLIPGIKVQIFLFALAVIMVISSGRQPDEPLPAGVIDRVVLIALAAMFVFVIGIIVNGIVEKKRPPNSPDVVTPSPEWPSREDMPIVRAFIIMGALIYIGYHFLDATVLDPNDRDYANDLRQILYVRSGGTLMILTMWCVSFAQVFHRHYVAIVSTVAFIAGLGIAAMMFIAGPSVHFYYEGFVQVIAFAAFAFRLPPMALAWLCAGLLGAYGATVAWQMSPGGGGPVSPSMKAAVINNIVSLSTFVALALAASLAMKMNRGRRSSIATPPKPFEISAGL